MSSASSASNSNNVEACLRGRFTIAGTKTFRIEHYSQSGGSGGAAVSAASTIEIYSDIKVWKIA